MADKNALVSALQSGANAVARGVPQVVTGMVDLAALPFTATGMVKPENVFGSTDYLTAKGLLPSPQAGFSGEFLELLASSASPTAGIGLALNKAGKNKLVDLLKDYDKAGPFKRNISEAIDLTPTQRQDLTAALSKQLKMPNYSVPPSIDLKPLHGYNSRVVKDGFTSDEYLKWFETGVGDNALVTTNKDGNPALSAVFNDPKRKTSYTVRVPVRGDTYGSVYADDAIPEGVYGPKKTPRR